MQKKDLKKMVIKVLVFGLIMILTWGLIDPVFTYKAGIDKYKDFYNEEQQFDVLFFGSSRVLEGIQPMELWEDYGIRSYNMAQHSESLGRDYWQLKNALKKKVPRLVVMDISAFYGLYQIDPSDSAQVGALHKQIDHIPLSATKIETVWELCPKGSRAEFLFPFSLYHSRWNELSVYDFTYKSYNHSRKGADVNYAVQSMERPVWDDSDVSESFPFENTKIQEIIDLCNEYNTSLLFINVPYVYGEERMSMLNYISNYLNDNNISYINYQKEEDFLDYSHDFGDASHLNIGGSMKLTKQFGRYFVDNYGVSESSEKTTKKWNEVLVEYKENKDYYISFAESYYQVLMMTYVDDDYYVKIFSSPERLIYTETNLFYPDLEGIDGYEGYRIEVYREGETEPFRIWE